MGAGNTANPSKELAFLRRGEGKSSLRAIAAKGTGRIIVKKRAGPKRNGTRRRQVSL